jgi:hypothetical protein
MRFGRCSIGQRDTPTNAGPGESAVGDWVSQSAILESGSLPPPTRQSTFPIRCVAIRLAPADTCRRRLSPTRGVRGRLVSG